MKTDDKDFVYQTNIMVSNMMTKKIILTKGDCNFKSFNQDKHQKQREVGTILSENQFLLCYNN